MSTLFSGQSWECGQIFILKLSCFVLPLIPVILTTVIIQSYYQKSPLFGHHSRKWGYKGDKTEILSKGAQGFMGDGGGDSDIKITSMHLI